MFGLDTPGELQKVKIIPCEDADFTESGDEPYVAAINPETYTEKIEIQYKENTAGGTVGGDLEFDKVKPQTIVLDLLFDSTGVIRNEHSFGTNLFADPEVEEVDKQIEAFKAVVMKYDGTTHQPRYLKVLWGKIVFKGRLTSLEIVYKLFKADGTPIRATGKLTIKESISKKDEEAEKSNNSPDLTHVRTVREGDTLPLMTNRIYGSPKYYLEVARVNQLNDFRNLVPGTQLYFPPVDKTT